MYLKLFDQTHYMPVTKMKPIAISTIFDQSHSMPAKSQNGPQHVVPVSTQNVTHVVWARTSLTSKHTKCTSTCIDQIHFMPARTQNVSQSLMSKPTFATGDTKCISTSHPLTVNTQNTSQQSHTSEDTNCLSTRQRQRELKIHLNLC